MATALSVWVGSGFKCFVVYPDSSVEYLEGHFLHLKGRGKKSQ
jgi:hypothetical protein